MEKLYTFDPTTRRPVRPFKALRHFRNLIANKEDTTQVFQIIDALNGNSFQKSFLRFVNSPEGRKRLNERRYLPPMLDDHESLKTLPEGSVGRAYLHFMESQGLTAQGLVDEYDSFVDSTGDDEWPEDMMWYGNRLRDTHDLLHIMTGYSRDALGEACVLGVSYSQHKGPGVTFISRMAGWEVKKSAPKGAPVMGAISEGHRLGKAATDLCYLNIEALLKEDLESARARLGYARPETYFKVHEMMLAQGMDPFEAIAAQPAAA